MREGGEARIVHGPSPREGRGASESPVVVDRRTASLLPVLRPRDVQPSTSDLGPRKGPKVGATARQPIDRRSIAVGRRQDPEPSNDKDTPRATLGLARGRTAAFSPSIADPRHLTSFSNGDKTANAVMSFRATALENCHSPAASGRRQRPAMHRLKEGQLVEVGEARSTSTREPTPSRSRATVSGAHRPKHAAAV